MAKKVFVTFADTHMSTALQRIKNEAEESFFFDELYTFSERDFEPSFSERFSDFISKNKRGYGYWIWKPYIIRRVLDKLNYGDFLIYLDAGCEVNKKGRKRFDEYLQMADASQLGILAFDSILQEGDYTKGDVIDFFHIIRDSKKVLGSGQIMSGIIVICKKATTQRFIEKWESICQNNLHLIDDAPSIAPNLPNFKENRHDQSILSLLINKITWGGERTLSL